MTHAEAREAMHAFRPVKVDGLVFQRIESIRERCDYSYFAEMIDMANCSYSCDVERLELATWEEWDAWKNKQKEKTAARRAETRRRYEIQ